MPTDKEVQELIINRLSGNRYKQLEQAGSINQEELYVIKDQPQVIDHVTLSNNTDNELRALGTTNRNDDTPKFDWVGTSKEHADQNIATLHPDWVCFITDDFNPGAVPFRVTDSLTKLDDYLYSVDYPDNKIDYQAALDFFKNKYKPTQLGGCSSIRKGNFFGRNFDWNYSETVTFVVNKDSNENRYASIGVSGGFADLNKAAVEARDNNELYRYLPFYIQDGINEHGLAVSVNVVPSGDKGETTGTHPDLEGDEICTLMLPAYILDNFKTAQEAVDWILNSAKIYAPYKENGREELHFLIADGGSTYVIEFIDNVAKAIPASFMTNFYLDGATFGSDSKVDFNSVTPYGNGLERYNIIAESYGTLYSQEDMLDLLRSLNYTKAYDISNLNNWWKTEFAAPYADQEIPWPNLTVTTSTQEYVSCGLTHYISQQFAARTRAAADTWQTVHTSVYDLEKKQLLIVTQEQGLEKARTFQLFPTVGDGKLTVVRDGRIIGEFSANQQNETTIDVTPNIKLPEITMLHAYRNGTSGYRIWSDGYCIQWGSTLGISATNTTITLLKTFADVSYNVTVASHIETGSTGGYAAGIDQKTTKTFTYRGVNSDVNYRNTFDWVAMGFLAADQFTLYK